MAKNWIARLAARFRRRFPGPKIKIHRAFMEDAFATCHFDPVKNIFVITLDKDLADDVALFVLPHEWAHALSWGLDPEPGHGPAFWAAYEQTYYVYLDFMKEDHDEHRPC